jgi:hypothetical protein
MEINMNYVHKTLVEFQRSVVCNQLATWLLHGFFKNAFKMDKLHYTNPKNNSEK